MRIPNSAFGHLPLAVAMLCATCDHIYPADLPECPACMGKERMALGKIVVPLVTRITNWPRRDYLHDAR